MKAPWHLWVIGIVSLLWNAMGAFDYYMTQTRHEGYLSAFTEEQLAFFLNFPTWFVAAWAVAVWLGVLGSALLLVRSRFAVHAFVVSFVAMVATTFHSYVVSDVSMTDLMGAGAMIFSVVIFIVALLLAFYAMRMARDGILR